MSKTETTHILIPLIGKYLVRVRQEGMQEYETIFTTRSKTKAYTRLGFEMSKCLYKKGDIIAIPKSDNHEPIQLVEMTWVQ